MYLHNDMFSLFLCYKKRGNKKFVTFSICNAEKKTKKCTLKAFDMVDGLIQMVYAVWCTQSKIFESEMIVDLLNFIIKKNLPFNFTMQLHTLLSILHNFKFDMHIFSLSLSLISFTAIASRKPLNYTEIRKTPDNFRQWRTPTIFSLFIY